MKTNKLSKYIALTGAGIGLAGNNIAEANIVYTDADPDINITISDSYQLDLNVDGTKDLLFVTDLHPNSLGSPGYMGYYNMLFPYCTAGSSYRIDMGGTSSARVGGLNGNAVANAGAGARKMNASENINASIGWGSNSLSVGNGRRIAYTTEVRCNAPYYSLTINPYSPPSSQFSYGPWNLDDAFIGVKFDISGNDHYGWVRIVGSRDLITIKEYAYESTPNTPIKAGDKVSATGPGTLNYCNDGIYGQQDPSASPTTSNTVFLVPKKINGSTSYTVEVCDNPNFTGTVYSKTGNTEKPLAKDYKFRISPATHYYVRVSVDGGNFGVQSDFFTHSVGVTTMQKIFDGQYGWQSGDITPTTAQTVFIKPATVSSASSYTVQISDTPDFSHTKDKWTLTAASPHQSNYKMTGLYAGTLFYVRVTTDIDNGVYGGVKTFMTDGVALKPEKNQHANAPVIEASAVEIHAFPNPTADFFRLNVKDDCDENSLLSITVYDLQGRIVYVAPTAYTNTNIEFGEDFNTGVYVLSIVSSGKQHTRQLIKQ